MNKTKYSFKNWYPSWIGFHVITFRGQLADIYKYTIHLGWFEIRMFR
jgi:hypothetical protein